MSTLTPAFANGSNSLAATPGVSGTPATVTFASDESWAIPLMIACSMVFSLTHVPSSSEKDDRT